MANSNGDSDSDELGDLFPDPEGYYKPPPQPTTVSFSRKHAQNQYTIPIVIFTNCRPSTLNIRLVGQHSLWAHHLWNAAKVLADYFDSHPELVKGKKILELGAAGALPSFTTACNGAEKVFDLESF
jgi:EEF1A N-terminal glycine/lysine methyltransferase